MSELHEHTIINGKNTVVKEAEKKLKTIFEKIHLSESEEHNLLVAASEAVNNAVLHGNKGDPSKKVMLDVDYIDDEIIVAVEDEGRGFNLENLPDPLLPENLLKPSGRGIHIMKSLMDSVAFEFTPKGTKAIMKLKVGKNKV